MIWKPKEKELTLEEAVAMAKKELSPFWFGSSPQIAGVKSKNGASIFPLNAEFVKQSWLIFLVDPTGFSGDVVSLLADQYWKRYSELDLKILVVFTASYSYLRNPEVFAKLADSWKANYAIALDVDQTLSKAFGISGTSIDQLPKQVLLNQNQQHLNLSGSALVSEGELATQVYLRTTDPGLALLPPYQADSNHTLDTARVELGHAPLLGAPYPFVGPGGVPGFAKKSGEAQGGQNGVPSGVQNSFKEGRFPSTPITGVLNTLRAGEILLSGTWTQDAEKIMTGDPAAALHVLCPSSSFGVVAQSLSKSVDHPEIQVEVSGVPLYEDILGKDAALNDDGTSIVAVQKAGFYHVAHGLTAKFRQVTLRFRRLESGPMALYGLRFGE